MFHDEWILIRQAPCTLKDKRGANSSRESKHTLKETRLMGPKAVGKHLIGFFTTMCKLNKKI